MSNPNEEQININNRPGIIRDNTPGKPDTGRPENIDLEQISKDQETLKNQDGVNAGIARSRSRANRDRKDARILREQTISTPGTPNASNDQDRPPFINQGFDRKQDGFRVTTAAGNEFTGNNVTGGNLGVGQSVQGIAPNPNSPRGNGRGILLPPGPGRELPRPPEPDPSTPTVQTKLDCLIIYSLPVSKDPVPEPIQTYFSTGNWDQLCEEQIGCPGLYEHRNTDIAGRRFDTLQACNNGRREDFNTTMQNIGLPALYCSYIANYGYARRSTVWEPGMPWPVACPRVYAYRTSSIYLGVPSYAAFDAFLFPPPTYSYFGGATEGNPRIYKYFARSTDETGVRIGTSIYGIDGKYSIEEAIANGWAYYSSSYQTYIFTIDGLNNFFAEYGTIAMYCRTYNPIAGGIPPAPTVPGGYSWGLVFSHTTDFSGCGNYSAGVPSANDPESPNSPDDKFFHCLKKYFVYSTTTKQIIELPLELRSDERSNAYITCDDNKTAIIEIIITNLTQLSESPRRFMRNCGSLFIYKLLFQNNLWTLSNQQESHKLEYTGQYIRLPEFGDQGYDLPNSVSESESIQKQTEFLESIQMQRHWNYKFTRCGHWYGSDYLPPNPNYILQAAEQVYLNGAEHYKFLGNLQRIQLLFNDGEKTFKDWFYNQSGINAKILSPKIQTYKQNYIELEPDENIEDPVINPDEYWFYYFFRNPFTIYPIEQDVMAILARNILCQVDEKLYDGTEVLTTMKIIQFDIKKNPNPPNDMNTFLLSNETEFEVEFGALIPKNVDVDYFRNLPTRWYDPQNHSYGYANFGSGLEKTTTLIPLIEDFVKLFYRFSPSPNVIDLQFANYNQLLTGLRLLNFPEGITQQVPSPGTNYPNTSWYVPVAAISGMTFCKH